MPDGLKGYKEKNHEELLKVFEYFSAEIFFFLLEVSVISSDRAFAQIVPLLAAFTVAASEFGSQTFKNNSLLKLFQSFQGLSCSFIFHLQDF